MSGDERERTIQQIAETCRSLVSTWRDGWSDDFEFDSDFGFDSRVLFGDVTRLEGLVGDLERIDRDAERRERA